MNLKELVNFVLFEEETSPEDVAKKINNKYNNNDYYNNDINTILSYIEKEIKTNKNNFYINGKTIIMNKENFEKYLNGIKNNINISDDKVLQKIYNQLEVFKERILQII